MVEMTRHVRIGHLEILTALRSNHTSLSTCSRPMSSGSRSIRLYARSSDVSCEREAAPRRRQLVAVE